jgi:hypothetical protein
MAWNNIQEPRIFGTAPSGLQQLEPFERFERLERRSTQLTARSVSFQLANFRSSAWLA